LAFGVSYNRVTTEHSALYFSDLNSLIEQINEAYTPKLQRIGKVMEQIALRRYKWEIIATKYEQLFEEVQTTKQKARVEPNTKQIPYTALLNKGFAHLKVNTNF
jgi:NAD(P)H-nitrite reductase large subunit